MVNFNTVPWLASSRATAVAGALTTHFGHLVQRSLCNFCPGIKSLLAEEIDIEPLMKCLRFLMKKDLECTDAHKKGGKKKGG